MRPSVVKATLLRLMPLLVVLLARSPALAQQSGTLTGTVTQATTGAPLAGAQVSIPALQLGTLTNAQGRFELRGVPAGTHAVRVDVIGYRTGESPATVAAGQSAAVMFSMEEAAIELETLVVTALGINREERAIGYAVQDVRGEQLNEARDPNVVNALAGKVAGVQIKNTGPLGGSSSISLRGYSSISGNNEPLFIVDGVPIDNSRAKLGESGQLDYGNAAQDLNPDDIESISVLKGANAAALYGSRAANGVILVTTKKGKSARGMGIQASTNLTFDTPMRLPLFQNAYGGGGSPVGFDWVDGAGGGLNDGTDESWGPAMEGQTYNQWFGAAPWLPNPYNVRQYYGVGQAATTSFSASVSSDRANVRLSGNRMDALGMSPEQELDRTTVSLNAGYDVTERLSLNGGATYVQTAAENRPLGSGGSLDSTPYQFLWLHRQVDMRQLEESLGRFEQEGTPYPEGHPGYPLSGTWNNNYWDNPYWLARYKGNDDRRDRLTGSVELSYELNDWLSVLGRTGTDWYEHQMKRYFPMYSNVHLEGGFREGTTFMQETNSEVLVSAVRDVSEDLNLTVRAGANRRMNDQNISELETTKLNLPGIYNPSNSAVPPALAYGVFRKRVNSVYGLASLGFRNWLFVDVTGRNDWSSTLPADNNSYFYPSVSSSFVFTDALPATTLGGLIQYGKVRASWAKVGNDADPYQLAAVYGKYEPAFGGVVGYTTSDTLFNSQLRPEETVSWEVGGDVRVGRVTVDLTYYSSSTRDQILPVQISQTSGFSRRILNAGEVTNQGFEALLTADILAGRGLQWTSSLNFGKNRSEVVSLHDDVETLILGSFGGLTVEARRGYPYGVLFGQVYQRNEQGEVLVSAQGRPLVAAQKEVIGNFQPDWTAGLENTFRFRDVSFSFLLDMRQGGEILCGTCRLGTRTGVLIETLEGREKGGIVFPGVKPDGTPNDVPLSLRSYWGSPGVYNVHERWVYDASFVKLREVKLGFDLPAKLVSRMPVSSARVALVGRNLALWTDVPHIDPEVDSSPNARFGVETNALPSSRSLGINLSVTR